MYINSYVCFFKQKTAYEMRISDWSSDVCSSDLTLNVTWRGKSAGEVLKMEVDEAVEFFAAHSKISRILQLMQDVGLGYLTLGQPSPTLSGGEAQRIKLVTELAKARLTDGVIKTGRASRIDRKSVV